MFKFFDKLKGIRDKEEPMYNVESEEQKQYRAQREMMRQAQARAHAIPSSLASSTYDYGMNPGRLQHEMRVVAERNELFVTTRKAIDEFQRNVFSNISEGQMDIKMSVVCRPGGPATMSFQLFIGFEEKLMEEKVEYPLSMSNGSSMSRDIDKMINQLMTRVLARLVYTAMYKVIEKVDTL